MEYAIFKENLSKLMIFEIKDIRYYYPDFRRATIYNWVSDGKLIKLRNGYYSFPDFAPDFFDLILISNRIYQPSYVSHELALSYYQIIPETVFLVTAVSTLKTITFKNIFGEFKYSTISKIKYFGYKNIQHKDRNIQIATLEKAILDYLYLNHNICHIDDFFELRWNAQILSETLNFSRLEQYLKACNNRALHNRTKTLITYIKNYA